MTKSEDFLLEYEHEIESTKKLISCIPMDKWDWKPHEKSMTLGNLAKHIVELSLWTKNVVQEPHLDFSGNYTPMRATTKEELLSFLEDAKREVRRVLLDQNDLDWTDNWQLKVGDTVLASMPRHSANRFIVNNHMYHHRGQLSVYLRLLDIPIPGMYGPSADQQK